MSKATTIGYVIALSFIELFFLPLPVTFLFLFLWSQFASRSEALFSAFIGGLFFDILLLRPIGTTSLLFLVLLFVGFLYQRKFQTENPLFVTILAFVSFLVLEFSYTGVVTVGPLCFYAILTVVLARIFFKRQTIYESWYRFS